MALSLTFKLLKWGYEDNNGPLRWGQWYPLAQEGVRQSPIDIKTEEIESDPHLGPLVAKYSPAALTNLENTSKSFQVHFHNPNISSLTGGPLTEEYKVTLCHSTSNNT